MSVFGNALGAHIVGAGLGALEDAVGAIESALGGVSSALKTADGLKDALEGLAKEGSSALQSLAKLGGCVAMDHTAPMIGKLAGEIAGRLADGKLSPGDKAAIKHSLADAGFDKQSRHKVMDSIQKMMLDGLTETMKKRHDGKGGGDSGKAASAEGAGGCGGANGAGGAGGAGSNGGVSIGEIARVLGEALNEQFKKLVDAANALGSNPSAQQTAQLQALSAQVNANAGALTNAQRSAEEALKAIARA